jgi:Pyruvate/2-oxoacid:ferredoxin oxidoreductase gamma subunit
MKYRSGEVVILFSSKEVKTIVETEKIGDIEIYYMDDSTSYSSTQIFSAKKFLEKNMEKICKVVVSEMSRNLLEAVKRHTISSPND